MLDDSPETNLSSGAPLPLAEPAVPAPPSQSNLWSWTDLVLFVGFAVLAFLSSSIFVTVVYVTLKKLSGLPTSPQAVPETPILPIALELVFYGLLFTFIYALVVGYHRQPFWPSLKWRRLSGSQIIRYSLGGFAMAIAVQLAPALLPDNQDFPLEKMFMSPRIAYAIGIFAVSVAPFMEELIFRGVLFSIFERQSGLLAAIVITAVLFASLHVQEYWGAWNHLLLLFLVGVVFSVVRGLTRSLAPSMVLHFAYNFTLMVGLFFATHHFRTLERALAAALF